MGCLAAEPLQSVRVELVAVGAPDSGVLVEYRRKYDEGSAIGISMSWITTSSDTWRAIMVAFQVQISIPSVMSNRCIPGNFASDPRVVEQHATTQRARLGVRRWRIPLRKLMVWPTKKWWSCDGGMVCDGQENLKGASYAERAARDGCIRGISPRQVLRGFARYEIDLLETSCSQAVHGWEEHGEHGRGCHKGAMHTLDSKSFVSRQSFRSAGFAFAVLP